MGTGVNLSPLFRMFFSLSESFRFERLIILMSFSLWFVMDSVEVSDLVPKNTVDRCFHQYCPARSENNSPKIRLHSVVCFVLDYLRPTYTIKKQTASSIYFLIRVILDILKQVSRFV